MKEQLIPTYSSKELSTISHIKDCALHKHKNCEFLFVLKGKIINKVNDMAIEAHIGDVFFVNNKVSHALIQTEDAYEHRDIYLSSNTLQDICQRFFDNNFYNHLMRVDNITQIHIPFEVFSVFEKRLNKNQSLYALYPQKKELVKKSNLNIIISLLGFLYEQMPEYPSAQKNWLNEFLEKVQNPNVFTQPIQDIIKLSNYSPYYFSHQFSKTFNMSFKSYVTKLKVDYAKLLLTSSPIDIVEVSFMCGFSSQSHFTQIFRTHVGVTPFQYRKSHLKKG